MHDLNKQIQSLEAAFESGQYSKALAIARRLTVNRPEGEVNWIYMAKALLKQGAHAEAIEAMRKALKVNDSNVDMHVSLAKLLFRERKYSEAEASCLCALRIQSDDAHALATLAQIYKALDRASEAEVAQNKAIEIALTKITELAPDLPGGHANLGVFYLKNGDISAAISSYRMALKLDPTDQNVRSNFLFALARADNISPEMYLLEAKKWDQYSSTPNPSQGTNIFLLNKLKNAKRLLRVGYVSGDFRDHVVSYFIEPVIRAHQGSTIELFTYMTSKVCDSVTHRMRQLIGNWRDIHDLSDEEAVKSIRKDDIDVLIDLSGHTAMNRLGVFARRAAPVQAHYLGYFASTGLSQMDYWIGDAVVVPSGQNANFSEKVWQLPRLSISYKAREDAPIPNWRACEEGNIYLGSFNDLTKITKETLELWAKLLHALPRAKLLLKTSGLQEEKNRERVRQQLFRHGVENGRLEIHGKNDSWHDHMAMYDKIDIALDPIGGQGGTTTTCEALWMGVPVINLAGIKVGQRMTAALVNALGHPEWTVTCESEYLQKTIDLAMDLNLRRRLRKSQREKMRQSPICDAESLARHLEEAYTVMFDQWKQSDPR